MAKVKIAKRIAVIEEVEVDFPTFRVIQDDLDDFHIERLEIMMLTENFAVTVRKAVNVINDVCEYSIEHKEIHDVISDHACYIDKDMCSKKRFMSFYIEAINYISGRLK